MVEINFKQSYVINPYNNGFRFQELFNSVIYQEQLISSYILPQRTYSVPFEKIPVPIKKLKVFKSYISTDILEGALDLINFMKTKQKILFNNKHTRNPKKQSTRCRYCISCLRKYDCNNCINCLDKPRNGGCGLRKRGCSERVCMGKK